MKSPNEHLIMEENHMDKLYNSGNPLIRFFHNQRLNSVLGFIPQNSGKKFRVLDAGCGEGHLLKKIYDKNRNLSLYGIDITEIALKKAKKRIPTAKITKQDLKHIEYKNNTFDIVICSDVLEHVPDYKKVISNLKRVVKKQGVIIISYPNEINLTISRFLLGIKPAKATDHVNSFTPRKMEKEFGMHPVKQLMLPFNLPFAFSLEAVQAFKNKGFLQSVSLLIADKTKQESQPL